MPKRLGFTLIELLIVITIIAILSAIALVAYTSFIKNARDAKRKTDANFIQTALEQYHADQHKYPVSGSGECPATEDEDGKLKFGCSLTSTDGSKKYLSTMPQDSISTNGAYQYTPLPSECDNETTDCNSYCLFMQMENSSNGKTVSGCAVSSPHNFSITRP